MSLCLTCSSTLQSMGYITPCCEKPICAGCLERNPRLKVYNPCLYCGDPTSLDQPSTVPPSSIYGEQADDRFMIGDDEEEEQEQEEGRGQKGSPPKYEDIVQPQRGDGSDRQHTLNGGGNARSRDNEPMEEVEIRHPIGKGDTILSIARRYGADPHEILKLNSLPSSVLSSQPHLLRTRRTLLISKRLVPKSQAPESTLFSLNGDNENSDSSLLSHADTSYTDTPTAEMMKREREKAVKRFQILTKSVDPRVGDIYLSLSEMEESSLDYLSSVEVDQAIERDIQSGRNLSDNKDSIVARGVGKSKIALPDISNRTERALEAFYEDEEWEKEVGGPRVSKNGGGGGRSGWKRIGDPTKMGIKV